MFLMCPFVVIQSLIILNVNLIVLEQECIKDDNWKSNGVLSNRFEFIFVYEAMVFFEVCCYNRFIGFKVGLPRRARIRIAFARLWLRLFYAIAEVVLDDAAFSFVTDRVRSLSAATAGDCAEGPIGGYPRIFRCSIRLFFRHGVFIT